MEVNAFFLESKRQLIKDMKERRLSLDKTIAGLEQELTEPPYKSRLDYEEIKLMAEHDIVQFDIWEQERGKKLLQ